MSGPGVPAYPAEEITQAAVRGYCEFDGYRAVAELGESGVTLYSRNLRNLSRRFPTIVTALRHVGSQPVMDGELVITGDDGKPDFQALDGARGQGHMIAMGVLNPPLQTLSVLTWPRGSLALLSMVLSDHAINSENAPTAPLCVGKRPECDRSERTLWPDSRRQQSLLSGCDDGCVDLPLCLSSVEAREPGVN